MKTIVTAVFILFLLAGVSFADQWVKGHYRDTDGDGYKETYVQPYSRTTPDGSQYNNYSSQGNVNPYTGKQGTVNTDNNYSSTYQTQPRKSSNYNPYQ